MEKSEEYNISLLKKAQDNFLLSPGKHVNGRAQNKSTEPGLIMSNHFLIKDSQLLNDGKSIW